MVFRRDKDENKMATIVLRGSTTSMLDDIERAIDDGVNTIKTLCRDGRMLPGAGGTEIHLAKKFKIILKLNLDWINMLSNVLAKLLKLFQGQLQKMQV